MRVRLLVLALFSITLFAETPKVVRPAEGYRIAGVVYDATSGQTLPGARVSLGSAAGQSMPDRSVVTGPDGSFAFDHLPAGKYQVYGEAIGYPLQGFEQHESPYLTAIAVGPGIAADHTSFRLQRGNVISGVITDEYNDPVRNARVMLFHRGLENGSFSTHFSRQGQSDDQGYYKFASLMPGTYFVAAWARPWYARSVYTLPSGWQASPQTTDSIKRLDVAFPVTFYSGATGPDDATGITVANGERVSADLGLHSVPAVNLHLRRTAGANGAVPFVRLSAPTFGGYDLPVELEQRYQNGEIIYTGLAPGRYLAHATIPGAEGERVEEIDVESDTTIDPDTFTTAGACSIKGLAQMADGDALPRGLVVSIRNEKTGVGNATAVDERGGFGFADLQPGSYEISVGAGRDIYLKDMAAAHAHIDGRSVTIAGSATAEIAITLGRGLAEIHGTALQDGKGMGGTMVLLVPANSGANYVLFRRDQSDSDGTFLLPRVVPGRYEVVAIQNGWELEWSKPEVLKPYLTKATPVTVIADTRYDIKVQVQPK